MVRTGGCLLGKGSVFAMPLDPERSTTSLLGQGRTWLLARERKALLRGKEISPCSFTSCRESGTAEEAQQLRLFPSELCRLLLPLEGLVCRNV